jgi:hypothetical protein
MSRTAYTFPPQKLMRLSIPCGTLQCEACIPDAAIGLTRPCPVRPTRFPPKTLIRLSIPCGTLQCEACIPDAAIGLTRPRPARLTRSICIPLCPARLTRSRLDGMVGGQYVQDRTACAAVRPIPGQRGVAPVMRGTIGLCDSRRQSSSSGKAQPRELE